MTFRYWLAEKIMKLGLSVIGQPNLLRNAAIGLREQSDRLARIAALETPNANATERKMAKIARGEL